jgi:hypothetical protein
MEQNLAVKGQGELTVRRKSFNAREKKELEWTWEIMNGNGVFCWKEDASWCSPIQFRLLRGSQGLAYRKPRFWAR